MNGGAASQARIAPFLPRHHVCFAGCQSPPLSSQQHAWCGPCTSQILPPGSGPPAPLEQRPLLPWPGRSRCPSPAPAVSGPHEVLPVVRGPFPRYPVKLGRPPHGAHRGPCQPVSAPAATWLVPRLLPPRGSLTTGTCDVHCATTVPLRTTYVCRGVPRKATEPRALLRDTRERTGHRTPPPRPHVGLRFNGTPEDLPRWVVDVWCSGLWGHHEGPP